MSQIKCAFLPKMQLAMKAVPEIHKGKEVFLSAFNGSHPIQLHQGDRLLAESTGTLGENKLRLFIQSCVYIKLGYVEPWENWRQGKAFLVKLPLWRRANAIYVHFGKYNQVVMFRVDVFEKRYCIPKNEVI